jgi:hypothetical protein
MSANQVLSKVPREPVARASNARQEEEIADEVL